MVGAAIEEADAELAFQPLHLLAQRRLHDVLPLRRPAEMQLLRQRHEIAKLTKLHARRQVRVQPIPALPGTWEPCPQAYLRARALECVTGLGRR